MAKWTIPIPNPITTFFKGVFHSDDLGPSTEVEQSLIEQGKADPDSFYNRHSKPEGSVDPADNTTITNAEAAFSNVEPNQQALQAAKTPEDFLQALSQSDGLNSVDKSSALEQQTELSR